MQIGHANLTQEERQRRKDEGACFYSGLPGHIVNQCQLRFKARTPRYKAGRGWVIMHLILRENFYLSLSSYVHKMEFLTSRLWLTLVQNRVF